MARDKTIPRPTQAETAILQVLWQRGPSTVRDIHEVLNGERTMGYTTVLKLLQIMYDKGLVRRDESRRSHLYQAVSSQRRTQQQLVTDLLDRAFGGSMRNLVMHALSSRKTSRADLAEIRGLLDELEEKQR
ncbi:MAG TPA: BlaI/MecI/CopY family transcriptional regulator [Pirellulales bacterium]|nr:BlaI/MecI/CopY family transcriptional regulator [Pirellulales bacterium]